MATKELKSMQIYLMGNNSYLNIDDTEENPTIVDDTMKQFLNSDQIHIPANDGNPEYYVPFHAIDCVYVYPTGDTVPVPTRPNPYGCEAGVGELWAFSNDGGDDIELDIQGQGGATGSGATIKSYEEWVDLLENHDRYSVKTVYAPSGYESEVVYDSDNSEWRSADGYTTINMYQDTVLVNADAHEGDSRVEIYVTKK